MLRLGLLALLAAFLLVPQSFAPLFAPLNDYGAPAIYDQGNLLSLALSHFATVLVATAASTIVAVALGIFVTRPAGAPFLPLSRTMVNFLGVCTPARSTYTSTDEPTSPRKRSTASCKVMFMVASLLMRTMWSLALMPMRMAGVSGMGFFTVMRRWYAEHRYGNVSTPQLIALAEDVSGQDLDAFFDTWLYEPGKPPELGNLTGLTRGTAPEDTQRR